MNRKVTGVFAFLVMTFSIPLLTFARTGIAPGGETAPWADVTATGSGSIASNHMTQYYLTLVANPLGIAVPTGDGWYDAGTNATITAPESVDINPGQSRYKFTRWTTDDMSEISNPLFPTTSVLIDRTKTATANYVLQYKVTFDQSGAHELPHPDTILAIDGVNHDVGMLPASFWYDNGSNHTFYYEKSLVVTANKKAFVWTSTTGLTTAQSGSIIVSSTGNITGNYKTQYYLTVTSQYGSPNPTSGWYDSEASVVASIDSPVSGLTGTHYVCSGWSGKGSVPTSGSGTATAFLVNEPSTLTWNWNTQHYLAVAADPLGLVTVPGEGWYDQSANVILTAPTVVNYDLDHWTVDGTSQGKGVNPITATMSAAHTATAHYIALSSPILHSCDLSGAEKNIFDLGQGETVYVKGAGFSPSATYTIHVVKDVVWVDAMDIPPRIANTSTSVMSDDSGRIAPTAIWNPPLAFGVYAIVVDVNVDGKYDQGIDVLDVEQNAFSVIPEFSISCYLLVLLLGVMLSASCARAGTKHAIL